MRSMIYDHHQPIITSSLLLLDICYHGMYRVLRPLHIEGQLTRDCSWHVALIAHFGKHCTSYTKIVGFESRSKPKHYFFSDHFSSSVLPAFASIIMSTVYITVTCSMLDNVLFQSCVVASKSSIGK